jgi:hypothetical protein
VFIRCCSPDGLVIAASMRDSRGTIDPPRVRRTARGDDRRRHEIASPAAHISRDLGAAGAAAAASPAETTAPA